MPKRTRKVQPQRAREGLDKTPYLSSKGDRCIRPCCFPPPIKRSRATNGRSLSGYIWERQSTISGKRQRQAEGELPDPFGSANRRLPNWPGFTQISFGNFGTAGSVTWSLCRCLTFDPWANRERSVSLKSGKGFRRLEISSYCITSYFYLLSNCGIRMLLNLWAQALGQ